MNFLNNLPTGENQSNQNHLNEDGVTDDPEFLIQKAVTMPNMVEYCEFSTIPLPSSLDKPVQLQLRKPGELSASEKEQILELFMTNMEDLYRKTEWGWDMKAKQKELFHLSSRFLILTQSSSEVGGSKSTTSSTGQILGYIMFRFEYDDEDEPEQPVIFLYELQVSSAYHRHGIGKYLMTLLEAVSEKFEMWKIMLTCFKINIQAMAFYRKIGYDIDVNSPSRCGHENESYEILSNKPNLK
jgi:ribosomal protein S18 acetylase RimI-like enzyme